VRLARYVVPVTIACLGPAAPCAAQVFTVLHDFTGGKDGASPFPGTATAFIGGAAGTLYGLTAGGDVTTDFGTIFKLTPPVSGQTKWSETVLYRFKGGKDGSYPAGRLLADGHGGFYDATFEGGTGTCNPFGLGVVGCGTVFHLTPPATGKTAWTETQLYAFKGGADGASPTSNVIIDSKGSLYGMTAAGGVGTCAEVGTGCGTVYRLDPPAAGKTAWTKTVLYAFSGGADGAIPEAGLTADSKGVLYGVTGNGGIATCGGGFGCGVVFSLTPPATVGGAWTETVLYRFAGGSDGAYPQPAPVLGGAGALFGTTNSGGSKNAGTVFEVIPPKTGETNWTEKVLYSFQGGADGLQPNSGLTPLAGGAYATTTFYGGSGACTYQGTLLGCGTVVKLSPPAKGKTEWTEIVLHSLNGTTDGAVIAGGLYADSKGVLYGGAITGGDASVCTNNTFKGCGTAFSLAP